MVENIKFVFNADIVAKPGVMASMNTELIKKRIRNIIVSDLDSHGFSMNEFCQVSTQGEIK